MPWVAIGGGVLAEPFALGLQIPDEPLFKFLFTENFQITCRGLRFPGNDSAEFAVGEGSRSMYRGWINS
jgi:hypothetical protein